ncbi:MAG: GspE/PulE family protein [Bacteroidota bacterium]
MEELSLNIDLQQLITSEQAWHYQVVPFDADVQNRNISFLVSDLANADIRDELELLLGKSVTLKSAPAKDVQRYLNKYYRKGTSEKADTPGFSAGNDNFLMKLLLEGKALGASDIHIEIYQELCRLRFRIDGMLIERYRLKKVDYPALINKIKIKASLDISEKRLPQDGRINVEEGGRKFDIRVSVLPTLYGEKIVMRYLSNDTTNIDIRRLGFSEKQETEYLRAIKKPNGIILISGPTGSGKTTTLYGTLKILNEDKRNIVTAEDPIEYTLDGINQVQLKESIGLTFAAALRTFLRQDPDIIMIGEIRDHETAEMAIRASLTGHLVLSTIHTNSAWGTIDRLVDMGVPPFLLSATLNMSIAQRLVRKLCPDCKQEEPLPENETKMVPGVAHHHVAVGCENCHYTGYKGRTAIYEMISIDHELADMIKHRSHGVREALKEKNIKSLAEQATALLKEGVTSLDEIYPLLLESE